MGNVSKFRRFRLISNNICYGPEPHPKDEVEQRLSLDSSGAVLFEYYHFEDLDAGHPSYSIEHQIDCGLAQEIMDRIEHHFAESGSIAGVTDLGRWELSFEDENGAVAEYSGPLLDEVDGSLDELSEYLGRKMGLFGLWAFNGEMNGPLINSFHMKMRRIVEPKPLQGVQHDNFPVPGSRCLSLIEDIDIDRSKGEIVLRRETGIETHSEHRFYDPHHISNFLDELSESSMFLAPPAQEASPEMTEDAELNFELEFCLEEEQQIIMAGPYYQEFLPPEWSEFMRDLRDFISFYDKEMLSLKLGMANRHYFDEGKLMYCSVIFQLWSQSYYYISDDRSVTVGDQVIVPVGNHDRTAIVLITKTELYDEDDAPMESELVKHIIRKCEESEKTDSFVIKNDIPCPLVGANINKGQCMEICDTFEWDFDSEVLCSFDPPIEDSEEHRKICLECPYNHY